MAANVGDLGERSLVRTIRRLVDAPRASGAVGPGDDAAVVCSGAERQAWSVDRQREGIHFESDWLTHGEIGQRAVTIAASDIWAMGAEPRWILCALEVPAELPMTDFEDLIDGLRGGAQASGAEIVGGDVGLGPDLALVTTVGGELAGSRRPLLRSGARPGDELWVVGEIGWAAAGRMLLASGGGSFVEPDASCVEAFRRPQTPVDFCRWAASSPDLHAMMDISDGLGIDLHRLCEESGVGAEVDGDALLDAVPSVTAASVASTPLDLALQGGDDYAMLCAASPGAAVSAAAGVTARRIGAVTTAELGIVLATDGGRRPLAASGWDPFRGAAE